MAQRNRLVIGSIIIFAVILFVVRACVKHADEQPADVTITPEPVVKEPEEPPYKKAANASPITGLPCDNYSMRPFAIMYSGDVETRPYFSNIARADFVVEMAHRYTHGGTRVMGVFGCSTPAQVGPMRSGRVDFLNVAAAFDAIYVPWGGDSTSKSLLKKRVHNHIDCNSEVAPGGAAGACFRASTAQVPLAGEDRAFSNPQKLRAQSERIGYRQSWNFAGYEHAGDAPQAERPAGGTLHVGFQSGFSVSYSYNPGTNAYERFFAGRAEKDFITGDRVAPKNVIVIKTAKGTFSGSRNYAAEGLADPWDGVDAQHRRNDAGQYPNFGLGDPWFDLTRSGEARFYNNGRETVGTWSKGRGINDPFVFADASGAPIVFAPGQIWLEVLESGRSASWSVE